jgi:hypothetical protein
MRHKFFESGLFPALILRLTNLRPSFLRFDHDLHRSSGQRKNAPDRTTRRSSPRRAPYLCTEIRTNRRRSSKLNWQRLSNLYRSQEATPLEMYVKPFHRQRDELTDRNVGAHGPYARHDLSSEGGMVSA